MKVTKDTRLILNIIYVWKLNQTVLYIYICHLTILRVVIIPSNLYKLSLTLLDTEEGHLLIENVVNIFFVTSLSVSLHNHLDFYNLFCVCCIIMSRWSVTHYVLWLVDPFRLYIDFIKDPPPDDKASIFINRAYTCTCTFIVLYRATIPLNVQYW